MRNSCCRTAASAWFATGMIRCAPIQTGIGPVEVSKPKARDRAAPTAGERIRFTSKSCRNGRGARRASTLFCRFSICAAISTGDFQEALAALLGKDAPNLSPSVIARLKSEWEDEYRRWQKRDLSARHYVYVWADGVYLQARMEPQAECMLVLIGATPEGKKELIGFQTGMRESGQSWKELLVDLKARGLVDRAASIAIGDGALGFWKALDEAFPTTRHQRCWLHKTLNVLDKLPEVDAAQRASRICARSGCRRTGRGRSGDDDLRREICAQIRQGRRMPDQGPRRCWRSSTFPPSIGRTLRTSDEIDKQFLRQRAIYGERERPRGEARRVGCKRRQASYSFLAGLRRSRTWPFGGRGRQASTKCW